MKLSLDFLVQMAQEFDLRAEQEEIIKHYQEKRVPRPKHPGEFALSATLRDITITQQEQDHEIDLINAAEPR
jgi:hypothetical protein